MLSLLFASILSSAAPSLAAVTITPVNGPVVQDSYIVKLKSSANRDTHLSRISSSFARSQSFVDIAYDSNFLKAYAGVFRGESLEQLLEDEANEIEYVVPNGIVDINEAIVQTDATWGLQAVSQRTPTGRSDTGSLNYTYPYDSTAQGEGVDIYIVDTGVFIEHSDFGGRATFGFAAGSYAKADGHGHGTHCAGTAAGTKYGVAKKASIIGVKVLSDAGSGSVADIAAGLQYVVNNVAATGKPSVASMSLGGSANVALDDAVKSTIAAGIPVTVAAGNSNANSQTFSPARVPEAITVGASTIANARSSFSNYGAAVDVFAPGSLVISAWRGGVNATNNISGTSMATPHVAGVVAALFSKEGVKSPAAIEARIIELSTPGVITGIPVTNPVTPNRFVYLGDIASEPEPTETSSTVTPTVTSSSSTPTPTEPSTTPTPTNTPTPTPTPIVVTVTVTPTLTLTLTV